MLPYTLHQQQICWVTFPSYFRFQVLLIGPICHLQNKSLICTSALWATLYETSVEFGKKKAVESEKGKQEIIDRVWLQPFLARLHFLFASWLIFPHFSFFSFFPNYLSDWTVSMQLKGSVFYGYFCVFLNLFLSLAAPIVAISYSVFRSNLMVS